MVLSGRAEVSATVDPQSLVRLATPVTVVAVGAGEVKLTDQLEMEYAFEIESSSRAYRRDIHSCRVGGQPFCDYASSSSPSSGRPPSGSGRGVAVPLRAQ